MGQVEAVRGKGLDQGRPAANQGGRRRLQTLFLEEAHFVSYQECCGVGNRQESDANRRVPLLFLGKGGAGRHQSGQCAKTAPLEEFTAIDARAKDAAEQRVVIDHQIRIVDAVAVLLVVLVRLIGRMMGASKRIAKYAHGGSPQGRCVLTCKGSGVLCNTVRIWLGRFFAMGIGATWLAGSTMKGVHQA